MRSSVREAARSAVGPRSLAWYGTLATQNSVMTTVITTRETAGRARTAISSAIPQAIEICTNSDRTNSHRTWCEPKPTTETVWIVSVATPVTTPSREISVAAAAVIAPRRRRRTVRPASTASTSTTDITANRPMGSPGTSSTGPSGVGVSGVEMTESSNP